MMSFTPFNNQIIHLASKISEADDQTIPLLLLKLKDLLDAEKSLKNKSKLIKEIWKYDFPEIIVAALAQDFSLVSGSWLTACQLSAFVVDCCSGYKSNGDEFISKLMITLLQNLTKMINAYSKAEKVLKSNIIGNLSLFITSLTNLMETFNTLTSSLLSSKHFMQFLMLDDNKLSLLAFSLLKNAIKFNRNIFDHLSESRTHSISDELTFKISSTTDEQVARVSISILLTMMDLHTPLLDLFASKRYKGFKMYLVKWMDNGFDRDINRFVKILNVQTEQQILTQKHHNSAIMIQSFYRGYKSRLKLKKAAQGIASFQRIYRKKLQQRIESKEKKNLSKQKREYAASNRRKEFVDSRSKQLKIIKNIPARTVTKFFDDLQHDSARKIQAAWLGTRTRKQMVIERPKMKKGKAVIVLQRQIRKWLDYRRKKRAAALLDLLPAGLTDERKVELQNVITNIRERFPMNAVSDEDVNTTHDKAFRMLNNHVMSLRQARRRDEHRKALLAQLSIQSEQLSSLPLLDGIQDSEIKQFTSYSTPIMIAARQRHFDTIIDFKKPWWEKLGQNTEDSQDTIALAEYTNRYLQDFEKQF